MSYETEVLADIKRFQDQIDDGEALERLERNPDFKKLIIDGYLHDLVLNLLYQNNGDNNTEYYQKLDSIKFFKEYLDNIKHLAEVARTDKPSYEEELNNTNQ